MDIRRTRAQGLVVAARTTVLVLIAAIAASVSGGTLSYFTLYIGAVLPIPVMTGFQAHPPTRATCGPLPGPHSPTPSSPSCAFSRGGWAATR